MHISLCLKTKILQCTQKLQGNILLLHFYKWYNKTMVPSMGNFGTVLLPLLDG